MRSTRSSPPTTSCRPSRRPTSTSRRAAASACAPTDALALEDSTSGIAAAKAAGLACIAVPQFAEADVSAADRVIDSLEELLAEV